MVIGILVVIFSTVFATQYATTKVGYAYAIVHPSNADIRFIGSDNSSDGVRVLRIDGDNSSGQQLVALKFGDWSARTNKTYTCAFGIVNEEQFGVNITHITVINTSGYNYMQIWLHGDRDKKAEDDTTSVFMYNNGTAYYTASSTAWTLDAGNNDPSGMNSDGVSITTGWDQTAHVRYSNSDVDANNHMADFVWVQISLNIPSSVDAGGAHTGTVEIHFEATTHWTPPPSTLNFGTAQIFHSASTFELRSVVALDSTHIVIGYIDGSLYGTAIVGTISGSSISFGSPVTFNVGSTTSISVASLDSTHIVIGYADMGHSSNGTAIVGTISGSSISFGSSVVFNAAFTRSITVASMSSAYAVIGYRNDGSSSYGTAVVGTISGNSISFGSAVVFSSAYSTYNSIARLDSTHVVIGYSNGWNSWYGTAIVGTISGNSISFGSSVVFESARANNISATTLDSTHIVIAYSDAGNSNYGTAIVGTVSGGNSISFGSAAVFESAETNYISDTSLDSNHVVIAYRDIENSNYGTAIVGIINGNNISFGSAVVFVSAGRYFLSVARVDSTHVVIGYTGSSDFGTAIVGSYV